MTWIDEDAYYLEREAVERDAAARAREPCARWCHASMAHRYRALASQDGRGLNAEAVRPPGGRASSGTMAPLVPGARTRSAARRRLIRANGDRVGVAAGAVAIGALAIGAIAIGAVAVGRLAIGRATIRRLEIDELVIAGTVIGRGDRRTGS